MENFALDAVEAAHVGPVYVKDLRSDVTVWIHGAPKTAASGFKEGRMVEMRGVLYEEGTEKRTRFLYLLCFRRSKAHRCPLAPDCAIRQATCASRHSSFGDACHHTCACGGPSFCFDFAPMFVFAFRLLLTTPV